jgi:hypothetical protein
MAKRNNNNSSSNGNYSLVKICAFWGVVLSGIAGLITFTLNLLEKCGVHIDWGSRLSGVCSMIAQIALYISVWLAAYDFVRFKGKTWRIIYFVFLILGILGLVGLGLGSLL